MVKVSEICNRSMNIALQQEWKTALTRNSQEQQQDMYQSPQKAEYWERPTKKLRRMESEPTSEHAAA